MENSDMIELTEEYVKHYRKFKYWVLPVMGFARFSIKNNRIIEKSWSSVLYGAFVLITAVITVTHLIYETSVKTHLLLYSELVIFLQLSIIINLFLLNITFGNRYNVAKLIEHSIEIDMMLGINDTKFMRDIADAAYTIMGVPVVVVQFTVVVFMYLTFHVSMLVHVTGSAYFFWAFFEFYDINYLLTHCTFLNLRTRYTNVALMKTLHVKVEYMPDLFLFNGIFWKSKHNDLVTFQEKADVKQFVKVYKMLFDHLNLLIKCFEFPILTGILCITVGSLITVQILIIYGKTGMDILRKYIMVSWLLLSWLFIFAISLVVDLFSGQIEQTKLICTYAQLKSINNEGVYKLTKSIFHALEIRVARATVYVFFFDPGVMLRLAASTFVYITAQLQISMVTPEGSYSTQNATIVK